MAEKRRIVEETLEPEASVARVARAHGVNANQVFHWRRQYRQGLLDEGASRGGELAAGSCDRGDGTQNEQTGQAASRTTNSQ